MTELPNTLLERGRAHYKRRQWADAFETLLAARQQTPLARVDLDRLVWSAALIGRDEAFLDSLERLHQACIGDGDARLAARAAFWIGFRLFALGEPGRASGWLARAERHLENASDDCAERGYLLLPRIFRCLGENDDSAAEALAQQAADIGERSGDRDLVAIARNLQGRAVLRQGRTEPGLTLLDEVMVTVTSGDLSPLVTGLVYCNVVATCQQVYALDRAREWTAALTRWCAQQPQLVTFTGLCLVHRSEIMQLGGDWSNALAELRRISDGTFVDREPEAVAAALYQQAELCRLQGRFDEAETAYREASRSGRDPQPGLALLRLAQGREEEAVNAVARALTTTKPAWQRARLLPAYAEIMLATGEREKARAAVHELESIAAEVGTRIPGAMAAQARGALALAEGDTRAAIDRLQHAYRIWHQMGAPYLTARIRVLLARAYQALGDLDGAELERDAAQAVFRELGAAPDLAALSSQRNTTVASAHGLSARELQVLRLVASGKTNKAIATELFLSERTIDRHVSHILAKLEVPSRAAATAFAYENRLLRSDG